MIGFSSDMLEVVVRCDEMEDSLCAAVEEDDDALMKRIGLYRR